ncbi:hypothetical protein EXU48_07785 [Occultella glacieicola]|uniref:Large extracellular alpha-helical protein n=1 Tax=Occultella glacieicola TaxID=2518684 RepID=A0ABY2E6B8_9MICO|nr:DUF5719 family protein [Occultella glacieicola]TDE96125.1 hypothetical protein EXU48_07785 [Occultella glacieicola]
MPSTPRLNPRLRAVARGVGAATTGLIVLGLTGVVVGAATLSPPPEVTTVPPPEIDVGAGPLSLVCSGPPRLATDDGADIDYDDEFGSGGVELAAVAEAVVLGRDGREAPAATWSAIGADPIEVPATGDVRYLSQSDPSGPAVLRAEPDGTATALAAGASAARLDSGDLRGLTASECQAPSSSIWLVGGATELGSSARLTLTNPGDTPVAASVDIWGAAGQVSAGNPILVGPGAAESILLESLSLEPRMAVRVTADGGRLTAEIQDSALNGVVPAGTDVVTASADPGPDLTIGPVPLPEADPTAPEPSVVRLANPNESPTTATVSLLGADGEEVLAGTEDMILEAGSVVDVSLAGIPAGSWTVRVRADQPVTGAAMITRLGVAGELDPDQPVLDRAWVPARTAVDHGMLTLPGLGSVVDEAGVALTNPLDEPQTVTLRTVNAAGRTGDPVEIDLEAGTSTGVTDRIDLADAVAVEVSGTAVLATAALTAQAADGELLTMIPLTPDADEEQSVAVRLGP